jgi:hypothetical protein
MRYVNAESKITETTAVANCATARFHLALAGSRPR